MKVIQTVLNIALAEEGYLEKASNKSLDDKTANAGNKNYNKFARDLDEAGAYNGKKNGFEWCTSFALWPFFKAFGLELAMKMTCQPIGGLGASCTYLVKYYRNKGRFDDKPEVGAQIFFKSGADRYRHTGLVYKVDAKYVYTIEGNTSGASGVIPNGGGVCRKKYLRTSAAIGGYGHPLYELAPAVKEENAGEEESDMVRYDSVEEMPAWAQPEARKLIDRGALKGKDGGKLDVSEDMLRTLIICQRMVDGKAGG